MAFDFPSAPTLNQVYTYAGKSWKWNGEGWALLTNSLSSLLLNEGSFTVTVAPTTLTGNQTQTIQNATGTVALSSNKLSFFAATTSAELAGVISDETGSGALVFATSPSLTTPTLGVASATSINMVAITAPATSATLTIADGKTLTASNTLTFTGTDTSSVAFGTGGTVAYTANKLSVFAATTSAELAGVISDETGSGLLVFGTSPSFTTSITTASTTFALVNATATTVNFAGAATALNVGAAGCLTIFGGEVRPVADNTYDLGDPSFRWANIYTGDLHLKNDRGDYTIVEEEDALTLRNNKTGKVYNFVLEERKA